MQGHCTVNDQAPGNGYSSKQGKMIFFVFYSSKIIRLLNVLALFRVQYAKLNVFLQCRVRYTKLNTKIRF